VSGGGVRILLQDFAELFLSAGKFFGPETALRENAVQLHVRRLVLRSEAKFFDGFGELAGAVVADAEESAGLLAGRIGGEGGLKWRDRGPEVALLELGEAEVELYTGKLGVQGERFLVGAGGFGVPLQTGKVDAEAGEGGSVAGISSDDLLPDLSRLAELALLLERLSFGRVGRLGVRAGGNHEAKRQGYPPPRVFCRKSSQAVENRTDDFFERAKECRRVCK